MWQIHISAVYTRRRCRPFHREEPPHVHVEREAFGAKFCLATVRIERSRGFGRPEIRRIEKIVEENSDRFLRAWYEYFGH